MVSPHLQLAHRRPKTGGNKKIAENLLRWKEKEVASECSKLKKRHEITFSIKELISKLSEEGDQETIQKLNELIEAVALMHPHF